MPATARRLPSPAARAGRAPRPARDRRRPGESLVYLYGSCDRAAVYPALKDPGRCRFRDRFTGRTHLPPEPDIRAFTELTAANELD